MDIRDVVKSAMAEAKVEIAESATVVSTAPETFEQYVTRMIATCPEKEIAPTDEFGEELRLPGFEVITVGIAAVYGMKWGTIAVCHEWREKAFQPHIVPTSVGLHFVRGFSRREWSSLQKKILEHTKDRIQKHSEENSDPRWAETEIQQHTEEMIVVAGCCDPKYTPETIRQIPTGVVSNLANCIMVASGHEAQPLPPLSLK